MGLSEFIVLLIISLHFVNGGGETFTSQEDKIIDDNLEKSERTARHANDQYNKNILTETGKNLRDLLLGKKHVSCQRLKTPPNVQTKCRDVSHCKIWCEKNFVFPGGASQLNVVCDAASGKWIVQDSKIKNVIPACMRVCIPPCQNNGECLESGICRCPVDFNGALCQNRKCNKKPLTPNGSKYSCVGETKCNVECLQGYEFPDGTKRTELECLNGEWHYSKSGKPEAPDCQLICDPQCENGGKCISKNMCQCSEQYRGPQCQYDLQEVCNIKKSGFHGNFYKCSFGVTEVSCMLNCPGDTELSGPYICQYSTGQFSPPTCLSNADSGIGVTFEPTDIYSLYLKRENNIGIDRSPKSALCATWSGVNLKTFDGTIFKAPLTCSHTLVSDKIDGTFDIILKACPYGSGYNCPHSLKIFWQSVEYTFEYSNGTVKLSNPQKVLPIPVQVKGMKVLPVAQHLRIDLDQVGISLLWDKDQFILIQATPGLWNRTGGMCGSFDEDYRNDFISKEGSLLKTSLSFTDSWRTIVDSTFCHMDNRGEVKVKKCDAKDKSKADEICNKLLFNAKFTQCFKSFNMIALMKSCVNDYCNCANKDHPETCNCDSISMLVKECEIRGKKIEHGWRDLQICPIQCSFGRIYLPCGPNVEPTCGSDVMPNKDKCNEGCFCPEGTVQYKESCIYPQLCPCTMGNKVFKAGSTIKKDCNTCSCENGVWACTDENCGARCSAIGDPHYTTFDGKKFDFMGKCSYYLLKTDNITVEAENYACYTMTVSCLKSVTISLDIKGVRTTVKLSHNFVLHVNGKEVLKLPKIIGNNQIVIRQASSTHTKVVLSDGISVLWDGLHGVSIDVPSSFRGKTSGLCGTFNSNTNDDFLTPEGDIETAVGPFANKWRTKDTCDQQTETEINQHPCLANPQMREVAKKHCAWLSSDIFLDCHWSVEPETYYENCIYDMCSCNEDLSKCFCPILSAYAAECARQGIMTDWRNSVEECASQCPVGQIYENCGDSCVRSCGDLATKDTCQTNCIEGCRCPKGEYLNDNNECVPANDCPCVYDGMTFKTGYKEVRSGKHALELCTCDGGVWKCKTAKEKDKEKYPPSTEIMSKCANKPNFEFSKCVPAEPETCKNMDTYVENLEDCQSGCVCMEGFVLDVITKNCVKPEDCPCHHGGKSYSSGDKITDDCNACLCQSGNWNCTTNECERTCSVWGDSHFTTFDNHEFDFQGACDYILSKGVAANGDSYSITIQNVLCGTLGVTCSKSLEIELDGSIRDSIKLSADSSYLDDQSKAPIDKLREELGSKGQSYNIYKAGLFTVIEIIPLKLQIKWDEGTRVYVKLGKDWKGRVNGLCGNYNDNANDDMKTPSQGLETSPFLFGHSWKLQEYCVAPTQQIDACKEHPQREMWAELKCGILKSSMFKECHSEVPVEKYLKRCIFDTCACDQGGDCECLCTAIAAYAHSCSAKGISIRWRTQHFCPMQCDPHCSEYKACTPACAIETCDNFLDQGIADRMCLDEHCIEGCQIKPCDEGMIYLNDSFTKCVPKSECKPLCMLKDGKTFYEGDVTFVDDCQTCRCTKKKEICSGAPCPTTSTTTEPSIQDSPHSRCTSGWTRWINRDHNKGNIKLNDHEKLPKYDHFESIYGTCEKEFMKMIECRVVDSHKKAELMDENVYCNLENGLICKGNCHDYELRVFCQCDSEEPVEETTVLPTEPNAPQKSCNITVDEKYKEHPDDCHKFLQCVPRSNGNWYYMENTCGPSMMFNPLFDFCDHIASVEAIKPECGQKPEPTEAPNVPVCPAGKVWSECANHCEYTCHYYANKLSKRGLCNPGDICRPGCVDETEPYCPGLNKMWRDRDTCVDIDECPCMSSDEKYIKPHSIYHQKFVFADDQTCQCINNTIDCVAVTTELPPIGNDTIVDKPCPICDNIVTYSDDKQCKCKKPLMWDGKNCVHQNMCPCVENHISYPVGTKFENKDCKECVCVLGGEQRCKRKKCPQCKTGISHLELSTCRCKCEPCRENEIFCPTSGICIPEIFWCNGIKDCEDDEPENCTISIGVNCPKPECPNGMRMEITNYVSKRMSEIFRTSNYNIYNNGINIIPKKTINIVETIFDKPKLVSSYNEIEKCPEYICIPEIIIISNGSFPCIEPTCPKGYEVEIDNSKMKPGDCLKYTCILSPQKDHVCELSGKSFITFDGTEFEYETCSHVLARDLVNSSWYISVQLNCNENRKFCRKVLVIKDFTSDVVLTIMPDQKLKFNDFKYTATQLAKSSLVKSIFSISQLGKTMFAVSHLHGFWVQYDEIGGIKIGISEKYIKTVDGLCGYFNGKPTDDKRLPNGTVTGSTNDFGDSWFDKKIPKDECYPQECSRDIQMKALSLCSSIKHISFLKCGKAVNYKQFVSKCIETTCDCLKSNKEDAKSCKCLILQGFVKQCLAVNPLIQLDTWRAVHQCEISCPAPLVHSECYKRRCEPSCDNLNGDDCPILPDACFTGCYCPEGTLRQGDTCIPINECKNCICDVFGASKYLTYDRKNFTFNGNCTYLLSRDIASTRDHIFQVYVTMDDCKKLGRPALGSSTSCAKSLHILHGEHIIHIQRIEPNGPVRVLIDGMEVKKLPFKDTWLAITETNRNELKLTLPESHVEVTSSFDDMAYSIRVPSIKYGSKMEGLCGDCNGNPDDDLKMNQAKKRAWKSSPSPVEVCDIVESWKADEPKLGLGEDECLSEDVPIEMCLPLPPEKDPCLKFFDTELFGECNTIVEPLVYVSSCQHDMCKHGYDQKGACSSLAAYARECARYGVCLNWRSPDLCPYECPNSMIYEPCGCLRTCDTIKGNDIFEVENINSKAVMNPKKELTLDCATEKSEGCFCPPGKVLDNDNCVPEEKCIKCDDGVHSAGETWKKDKCTECICQSNGKIECSVQQCSVQESICSEGFMPSKISSSEECCPKYVCVHEPGNPPPKECPTPPIIKCGSDQYQKKKNGSDGCPQFICECKPISECEPFPEYVPLNVGEKLVSDYSGCCPNQTVVCDTNTCPKLTSTCSQKFYEHKIVTYAGDCCPTVVCSPPKDKCIVQLNGIETLKTLGDTWNIPGQPCLTEQCTYGPNDTTQVTKTTKKCDKTCKRGYSYESSNQTKCCGSCVQSQCFFEENLYSVGDIWFSVDNCTTFTCMNINGQLMVDAAKDTCGDVSGCPPEQLEDVGCCKICKPSSPNQNNCSPKSLSESQTIGFIRVNNPGHGICLNKEPILGITECYGSCESGSKFNAQSFGQEKMCSCCSIEAYKTISVILTCYDGVTIVKDIEIPSACGCSACSNYSWFTYTQKPSPPVKGLVGY